MIIEAEECLVDEIIGFESKSSDPTKCKIMLNEFNDKYSEKCQQLLSKASHQGSSKFNQTGNKGPSFLRLIKLWNAIVTMSNLDLIDPETNLKGKNLSTLKFFNFRHRWVTCN